MTHKTTQTCSQLAAIVALTLCSATAAAQNTSGLDDRSNPAVTLDRVVSHGVRPEEFSYGNWLSNNGLAGVSDVGTSGWGPLFIPNAGDPGSNQDTGCGGSSPSVGNPIVMATGAKVESETDFVSAGQMGLYLRRNYVSNTNYVGMFGSKWLSNFDQRLVFQYQEGAWTCSTYPGSRPCDTPATPRNVWSLRPDGRLIKFWSDPRGLFTENKAGAVARLVPGSPQGSWYQGYWTLNTEEHTVEVYRWGLLQSVKDAQGVGWTLSYGGPYGTHLQSATHSNGRQLKFTWSGDAVVEATNPVGSVYRYSYDSVGGHPRLLSTTLPGQPETTVSYLYGAGSGANWLMGKSYGGTRYSYFDYDAGGRATKSEHAGGVDQHVLSYTTDASGTIVKVLEDNPLGKRTEYGFDKGKLTATLGVQSAHCAASAKNRSYDSRGYDDVVTDFSGNRTDFDYDDHGHLIRRSEAAGTPSERTTTYTWDEARNKIANVTTAGVSRTDYAYTNDSRVAAVTVTDLVTGQARTTNYGYQTHANGLVATATIDAPGTASDVTMTYSPTGDLLTVINAGNQATTYANYNAAGQPGRVTSPTGAVAEYEYDARGRVTMERAYPNGSPVETRYTYGASGLLEGVQSSDGNAVTYHYDAARRLVQEDVTEPGGGHSVRRTFYNAMSRPTRVEVGKDN